MKRLFVLGIAVGFFALLGCDRDEPTIEPVKDAQQVATAQAVNSCVGCHTNYSHLREVADDEEPPSGGGGCGGTVPYYEPYDRVYLDPDSDNYKAFKASVHGQLACVECHNGDGTTADKDVAHAGDFVKHPSMISEEKCASCHPDVVARAKNSIHEMGWGQKRKVTMRYGLDGAHQFDQLPEAMKEGYDEKCGKCHAQCGDCHVIRPAQGGGGLASDHNFSETPHWRYVCVTCHVSRGGHAFLGQGAGAEPDVHFTKAQFTCLSCHSQNEVHGDGVKYEHRYKMALLPECLDCHADVASSNTYHSVHVGDFDCYVCHAQDYNNCGNCHIEDGHAGIPSYMGYKIGRNPIKDENRPYDFCLVRRAPMGPESWDGYGVPTLANFNVLPTWNYTSPHAILKRTARTDTTGGRACYDACHIIDEGDTVRNKELYLFADDLSDFEKNANDAVVVDNETPWGF
ncbi:MAG: hypothetical protein GF419_08185 [Ignavibacteriales bacterium]|nr:hypothetical protein [Ignavibacteriales bacterium]